MQALEMSFDENELLDCYIKSISSSKILHESQFKYCSKFFTLCLHTSSQCPESSFLWGFLKWEFCSSPNREVINRMLKYFQKEGMVKLSRGTVEIADAEKLEELCEE